MSELYSLLKNNYQDIEVINVISTLWSGCGEIIRCRIDGETRVIKLISMPDFIEHSRIKQSQFALARKQQSYLVEYNWYKQYSSSLPDQAAAIPCFNQIQKQNQFALIFDDFTAFGYQQAQDHTQHIHAILKWLAHFHAFHLSTSGEGLWPRGSYWHLATRPDEYARMPDSSLKAAAVHIDCALYQCKYQTLIHGDAKRANFAINSQTNHVLGYDFQYVGKGVGVIDVMYFLGSCLNESALKLNAHTYLNRYFAELNTALKQYQGTINADDLISSWRDLWCYAWADFYRFLSGWSPQHVKINGYMQNQFNEYLNKNRNTMNKPIRFAIIGCGAVTEVKSGPAYQQVNGIELIGVTRRDLNKAHDYATRHTVPKVFATNSELINDEMVDAVYIATPPDSHKDLALEVAKAGKPCCIEKPLAPSYEESYAIVEAFKDAKQPLFVAYYRRSLPRFNKVKELIQNGQIGQVRHVSWHLSKVPSELDLSGEYNWRTDKRIARGGYFDDLASHGLDLFAYLLGEFTRVHGFSSNQQGLYSAFDAVTAQWQHSSGVTGVGSWNFASAKRFDDVVIYGSKGEIRFSVFDEKPIELNNLAGKCKFSIENPVHIQQFHVENIARFFDQGAPHPSTGESALHTSWVMEQILAN